MSVPDVTEEVLTILVETLCLDHRPTVASSMVADLNADSLDLLDTLFQCEKHFGIEIDRSELVPARSEEVPIDATVGRLVDLIQAKVNDRLAVA